MLPRLEFHFTSRLRLYALAAVAAAAAAAVSLWGLQLMRCKARLQLEQLNNNSADAILQVLAAIQQELTREDGSAGRIVLSAKNPPAEFEDDDPYQLEMAA